MLVNENEKRDKAVLVKMNASEKETIVRKAKSLNMKVGAYLRFLALNTESVNFKINK